MCNFLWAIERYQSKYSSVGAGERIIRNKWIDKHTFTAHVDPIMGSFSSPFVFRPICDLFHFYFEDISGYL